MNGAPFSAALPQGVSLSARLAKFTFCRSGLSAAEIDALDEIQRRRVQAAIREQAASATSGRASAGSNATRSPSEGTRNSHASSTEEALDSLSHFARQQPTPAGHITSALPSLSRLGSESKSVAFGSSAQLLRSPGAANRFLSPSPSGEMAAEHARPVLTATASLLEDEVLHPADDAAPTQPLNLLDTRGVVKAAQASGEHRCIAPSVWSSLTDRRPSLAKSNWIRPSAH